MPWLKRGSDHNPNEEEEQDVDQDVSKHRKGDDGEDDERGGGDLLQVHLRDTVSPIPPVGQGR